MIDKTESTHEFTGPDEYVVAGCWLSASETWCDFKLFEVAAWDNERNVLGWAKESQQPVGAPVMVDADPIAEGHIKWDGCIELRIDHHMCDGAESVQQLHTWVQWMLAKAHEAMGDPKGWRPLP